MPDVDALLSYLDLSRPELAPVRSRVEAGDPEGALTALVDHFRTRTAPPYLFDRGDIARFEDAEVVAEADAVCAHRIFGYFVGEEVDWHTNQTQDSSRDPEWLWSLARHNFWVPLARAYALTGDEEYAREFAAQLKGFVDAWPVEPHLEYLDPVMSFPGNAWRSIEAGIRIYTSWLPCLVYFRGSPSLDDEAWLYLLSSLHDHGEFLMTHYSNHKRCSNWLTMEATALFQLGVMFPEFKRSREWRMMGYRRIAHEVRYQFDHHGVHMERTPIYHLVAAGSFLQAYRLAQLNGMVMPPYALPVLEGAAEYLMRLVKPDFSLPMVGDADRNSLLDRKADQSLYEGMNLTTDPQDLNEIRAFFRVMADLTGREDFRYFATGRRQGAPPRQTCYSMPDPGFYVFRSGWEPDDSYFMVTGTNLERGENRAHSHFDAAHLELQIRGEDVLVDCGRYIYGNSAWIEWRTYFTSTGAHNTVLVDGHEMGVVPDTSPQVRGVRTWCHRFQTGPDLDLVEVSHNGYAYMDEPVFHLRRVLHLKPGLWLVDDVLTGTGEHRYELFFNFPPGTLDGAGSPGAFLYSGKRVRARLTPLLTEGLRVATLEGSLDPIGGWVSYGYGAKVPAPQVIYSREGPVPARFLTAIVDEGSESWAHVVGLSGGEVEVELNSGQRARRVRLGLQAAAFD